MPISFSSPARNHPVPSDDCLCTRPPLTTRLFLPDVHRQEKDPHKTLTAVDLSKFRKEVAPNFLGLKVQDPDDLAVVLFNPNSKRKSPIVDDPDEKKKKKIQRNIIINSQPQAPRDLSPEFLRNIKPAPALPPVFLYRKCLSPTDVHRSQNRLLVTNTENVMQFLTHDEEHEILNGENNYIQVIGIDCIGRDFDLRLSTWGDRDREAAGAISNTTETNTAKKKKKKMSIVFNKEWCDLLEANGVKPDDIAELWGFRREAKFCLAANFIKIARVS